MRGMTTDQPAKGQPQPSHRTLRRIGGGAVALVIGLAAVVALIAFFNSRDDAGVDTGGSAQAPGEVFDQPQQYLDARQVTLLRKGDVYVVSARARAPALVGLRDALSGPPDPVLEQAGQAVVLVQKPGVEGVVALAHGHRLVTQDPSDPALERFAAHWLGRGAG
jgi:hypothetical protein